MAFNSLQIVLNLRKKKVKQYFPQSADKALHEEHLAACLRLIRGLDPGLRSQQLRGPALGSLNEYHQ